MLSPNNVMVLIMTIPEVVKMVLTTPKIVTTLEVILMITHIKY